MGTHVVRRGMPLGGHSWGIHPSRGHTWPGERVHRGPLTGKYIPRRATSPWEGKCISRVSLKAGGQILFLGGHTARGRVPQGSIYGQGHSTTEVTSPGGHRLPAPTCTLYLAWGCLCRVTPHSQMSLLCPIPTGCHPALSNATVQQLGTSLQWGAPSSGSPQLDRKSVV